MKGNFEISKSGEGMVPCVKVKTIDGKIVKSNKKKSGNLSVDSKSPGEKAEIKAYIKKLQDLVPFIPKDKRLPKAEVISHVIDYFHDLRETLGLPPCINHQDGNDDDYLMMTVSTSGTTGVPLSGRPSNVLSLSSTSSLPCSISTNTNRQPFGVILNPRTF